MKDGLGRLDYGPWVPCILAPAENHRKVEAPIVVLANLYSVSMSEMTSLAVSALPNGCIVGKRTFGGTGPLSGDFKFAYSGAWGGAAPFLYYFRAVSLRIWRQAFVRTCAGLRAALQNSLRISEDSGIFIIFAG